MGGNIKQIETNLLGKEFSTKNCGKCSIVGYGGYKDVTVRFNEPECVVKCTMSSLVKGNVKNPLKPQVQGKGYLGIGKYGSGGKHKDLYKTWSKLINRVYNEKLLLNTPTYKDVEVCDEWLCFQNFAKWCEGQEFFNAKDDKGNIYQLDKDILVKGNKIYSPETCCFVPKALNSVVIRCESTRGDHLIGTYYCEGDKKFYARMKVNGVGKHLGLFDREIEAFYAYKTAKESYVRSLAKKWKVLIDNNVYETLLNYEVDIND